MLLTLAASTAGPEAFNLIVLWVALAGSAILLYNEAHARINPRGDGHQESEA